MKMEKREKTTTRSEWTARYKYTTNNIIGIWCLIFFFLCNTMTVQHMVQLLLFSDAIIFINYTEHARLITHIRHHHTNEVQTTRATLLFFFTLRFNSCVHTWVSIYLILSAKHRRTSNNFTDKNEHAKNNGNFNSNKCNWWSKRIMWRWEQQRLLLRILFSVFRISTH